jgi:hypothetical protein
MAGVTQVLKLLTQAAWEPAQGIGRAQRKEDPGAERGGASESIARFHWAGQGNRWRQSAE